MTKEEAPAIDCVERERLLKIYEDRFLELQKAKQLKENKGAEDRQLGVNYCINILREMPSVTPQPNNVLDKIRAEIEQKCCITVGRENDPAITLHDVFQIIDKYKAESEKV